MTNTSNEKDTALLIDGTALYLCSKDKLERLDYVAFDQELKDRANVNEFDPVISFTTYDPSNIGQTKFHDFVRARLRWEIEAKTVHEAWPLARSGIFSQDEKRNELIRFDSSIAFAIGRLLDRRNRIVVVTDSYNLSPILTTCARCNPNTEIVLAFFGKKLDSRWNAILENDENQIEFWDLDFSDETLFNSTRTPFSQDSVLGRL